MFKIRPFVSVLFSLLLVSGFSQEWILQNPFNRTGKVLSIDIAQDGKGYAVGTNGLIVTTDDFGTIWTLREPPVLLRNAVVRIVPGTQGQTAYVGGQQALKTEDGGITWERLFAPLSNTFDVFCLDEDHIYFASVQGGIFKTEDGGSTFTQFTTPYGRFQSIYFKDPMNGWATGSIDNEGKILRTTDGGDTWTILPETYSFVRDIAFGSDQVGYIATGDGLIKTTDGGESWNLLQNSPDFLDHFFVYDEDIVWVAWGLGYQKTEDGGQTWSEHNQGGSDGDPESLFLLDADRAWIGSRNVTINLSTDGGESWADQIPGNKSFLSSVRFSDDQHGYATSVLGEVLRTSNGGALWEESTISGEPQLVHLELIDQNRMLATSTQGLYISVDQAVSWNKINSISNGVESVSYINDNRILYTSLGRIFKTNINGDQITEVLETGDQMKKIYFVDDQNGWAINRVGKIYSTSDGGDTWALEYTQVDGDELVSLYFYDDMRGYALARFDSYILRTEDGGDTWFQQDLGRSTFWGGIHFMDQDTGWIVGGTSGTGLIMITNDGGDTWESDFSLDLAFADIYAPIPGEKLVWAVGAGGLITRFSACNTDPSIFELNAPTTVCKNDTISVDVSFDGIDIFEWSVPEGWVIFGNNTSSQVQVITGNQPGDISVVGKNSCEYTTSPLTVSLTPMENPEATILQEDEELISQTAGESYQWYQNGNEISGATDIRFTPIESGDYFVRVQFGNGCVSPPSNTINITISSVTTIDGRLIDLYPNPASHSFYLTGVNPNDKIELWSISGQLMRPYEKGVSMYSLDGISSGLYIIRITSNKQMGVLKIMVE